MAGAPRAAGAGPDGDAAAWQRLRAAPGHYSGAPWNDEVDRWDGAKHRLMRELAARLVAQRAGTDELRALLGRPDGLLSPGDAAHALAGRSLVQPCPGGLPLHGGDTLWLYDWRGRHDRLALALRRGRVVGCGWLLAWE